MTKRTLRRQGGVGSLHLLLVLGLLPSSASAQTLSLGPTIIQKGTTIEILDASVDIQAVIDGIADASAAKPYLVKLGPGVYDLGGGNLLMREFVSFSGSGQTTTEVISRLGSGGVGCVTHGVVVLADNMELSDLTVTNDHVSSGHTAVAVCVDEGISPRISRVTGRAVADGGSGSMYGFRLYLDDGGGEPELTDLVAIAGGVAQNAFGIYCNGGSFTLSRATVRVSGAVGVSRGIWLVGDCSPEMRELSVDVADGLLTYGIQIQNTSKAVIFDARFRARLGTSSSGVHVMMDASPNLVNVIALASDGATNRGIEVVDNADVIIRRSSMSGSDAGLYSDSTQTVFVTQSTLRKGTGGTGTLDCVATDDGAGTLLGANCT